MGSTEIATYYLASSACEFSRILLERAIEGGFQFLDAIAEVDICECMNRCYENMEPPESRGREKNFFISYVDVPGKDEEITVEHVVSSCEERCWNRCMYGMERICRCGDEKSCGEAQ